MEGAKPEPIDKEIFRNGLRVIRLGTSLRPEGVLMPDVTEKFIEIQKKWEDIRRRSGEHDDEVWFG